MVDDQFPQAEADRRRDEGLRNMLRTPPKPHKTLKQLKEGAKSQHKP